MTLRVGEDDENEVHLLCGEYAETSVLNDARSSCQKLVQVRPEEMIVATSVRRRARVGNL